MTRALEMEDSLRRVALAYLQRATEAEAALQALVRDPGSEVGWAEARRIVGLLEPEYRIGDPATNISAQAAEARASDLAAEHAALVKVARAVDQQMNDGEAPVSADIEDAMSELFEAAPHLLGRDADGKLLEADDAG